MATIRIIGAIDRNEPDPTAPGDAYSKWIGRIVVSWVAWNPERMPAAVLKVSTGSGNGDRLWGTDVLVLRWLDKHPPAEIAQAVYDVIRDGGPRPRSLDTLIETQPLTEAQPSYRTARA